VHYPVCIAHKLPFKNNGEIQQTMRTLLAVHVQFALCCIILLNGGYGCYGGYRDYGKRSAEALVEASAEPGNLSRGYGGYGINGGYGRSQASAI
jgi:hypothetical protein